MKIVLDHLTKRFPNRNRRIGGEVTAVDQFDVEIPDGELVGLLGPSGCGKSTVLNLICGLEKPTEGRVFFGEEDVTDLSPENRGVGMVFQSYALYPHMTVRENIRFPLENRKGKDRLSKAEMEEKVLEAAKIVQIDQLLDRKPGEMSGGQQQRVAIARALVKRPKVLLLDEPLSNLDARLRLSTREEIRRIQMETGITTVFVTHDQEEAMSISDHIIVMKNGKKLQVGKPQDVYDDPSNLFIAQFLGTPAINVFLGEVKNGKLLIGSECVLDVSGAREGNVVVGIRPEGVSLQADGPFTLKLDRIEILGRDTIVIASHPSFQGDSLRVIIPSELHSEVTEQPRFVLKPRGVHLFDPDTQERIRYGNGNGMQAT